MTCVEYSLENHSKVNSSYLSSLGRTLISHLSNRYSQFKTILYQTIYQSRLPKLVLKVISDKEKPYMLAKPYEKLIMVSTM